MNFFKRLFKRQTKSQKQEEIENVINSESNESKTETIKKIRRLTKQKLYDLFIQKGLGDVEWFKIYKTNEDKYKIAIKMKGTMGTYYRVIGAPRPRYATMELIKANYYADKVFEIIRPILKQVIEIGDIDETESNPDNVLIYINFKREIENLK